MMKITESKRESKDGITFYSRTWEPEGHAKAVVALVHGHGEHIGRYENVANALTNAGYALAGYDSRGHGKSTGPRGHIPTYDALMDDIGAFISMLGEKYSGQLLFLYGHSMGGNQVINYALRRHPKIAGVIATGPWLKLAFEPSRIQVTLARIMNNILPSFTQPSGLDTKGLSHDAKVVDLYNNDSLNHNKVSARLFVSIYESGLWALDHASELSLPLLLMHGGVDPVTSAAASRQFASRAGKNVTLSIWDGLYHEIHNEPEQTEVFKVMVEWLDQHL